jgi:hypothetical protein
MISPKKSYFEFETADEITDGSDDKYLDVGADYFHKFEYDTMKKRKKVPKTKKINENSI